MLSDNTFSTRKEGQLQLGVKISSQIEQKLAITFC